MQRGGWSGQEKMWRQKIRGCRERESVHKCGGRWRAGGVAADGWGKEVVLSIAACYHPPQPGRQFD